MSLLETAGFSRANPYYVVQQGKVRMRWEGGAVLDTTGVTDLDRGVSAEAMGPTARQLPCLTHRLHIFAIGYPCPPAPPHRRQIMAMANMKDGERLELLKEIGGTRVYEERRRESEKLMAECETKRETIQGLVRDSCGGRVGGGQAGWVLCAMNDAGAWEFWCWLASMLGSS